MSGFELQVAVLSKAEFKAACDRAKKGDPKGFDDHPSMKYLGLEDRGGLEFLKMLGEEIGSLDGPDEGFPGDSPTQVGNVTAWRFPKDLVEELASLDDESMDDAVESLEDDRWSSCENQLRLLAALATDADENGAGLYVFMDQS